MLPEAARAMFRLMLDCSPVSTARSRISTRRSRGVLARTEVSRRLMTVPGIGPISATAIAALAPPAETFAKGRDFAAWLGLTPLQRSTGGKRKLGATSKMGERTLRRLLIIGSSTVVLQASKRGLLLSALLGGRMASERAPTWRRSEHAIRLSMSAESGGGGGD
jgi:transposase